MDYNSDFCKNCGALIDGVSNICPKCGADLYGEKEDSDPLYRDMKNIQTSTKREYSPVSTKRNNPKPSNNKNKILWALIVIAAVILVGLIIVLCSLKAQGSQISINEGDCVLLVGEKTTLTYTTTNTSDKIIWSTSDSKIVSVVKMGNGESADISGMAEGTATVSVKVGSAAASVEITVKLDHDWDEGTETVKATCEDDGEITYKCKDCGKTKTDVIKAIGHKWSDEPEEYEQSEEGCIEVYICENDNTHKKTQTVEHTFGDPIDGKEPTCQTAGEKVYTCSKCGYSYTEETEKVDHVYVDGKCMWCGKLLLPGAWKCTSDSVSYILTVAGSSFTLELTTGETKSGTYETDSSGGYTFKIEDDTFAIAKYDGKALQFNSFDYGNLSFSKIS